MIAPEMDAGWAYVAMIDRLTGGDITKDESVLQIEYISCLTRMLYWKDYDEWKEKINRINEQKFKSKRR